MKFITTSTSQRQEESWKMSEILFFHWDIDKNCSNSRGTGKGNNKNAGNIFQCSGELNGTRSGTERRWKKRCSGALSIISVTQSGAERRKKKCPGNILTRSRAGQGKESYFNIVDRKKKFPYVGITIQNPAIPKTRKRALVTNTLAYSKTLYFTDTKRFSTLSKSKSPNQAR